MKIKGLILAFLLPAVAVAQINMAWPGKNVTLGAGVSLTAPDFDADAIAYFARAGVTDATAKRQISDFVKGAKALGIWSNLVCWPLRSSQNAQTPGTTVYSLGGFGPYEGSLINGPNLTADGLVISSATRHLAIAGLTTFVKPQSFGVIGKDQFSFGASTDTGPTSSSIRGFRVGQTSVSQTVLQVRYPLASGYGISTNRTASPVSSLTHLAGVARTTGLKLFINGTLDGNNDWNVNSVNPADHGAVTINPNTTAYIGATGNSLNSAIGTTAFAWIYRAEMSDSLIADFTVLYKSTLGQGLGLP